MKKYLSLRIKIILGIILAVCFLAAVLITIMINVMNFLSFSILSETMRPMARTAALAVQGNLHLLSDRIFLIRNYREFTNPAATLEEKQNVLTMAGSGIEFVWLGLYTVDGELETGSLLSPERLGDDILAGMKASRNLVISDTSMGPDGELQIVVGTPVLVEDEPVNYIVGSYKYEILNDILGNISISSNCKAFIINEKGTFIAHRNVEQVITRSTIFTYFTSGPELDAIFNKMKSGIIDSAPMGSGADRKIFSFAPIRGTRWFLAIDVPQSDFLEPVRGGVLFSISAILVVLLLFIAAANFFVGRVLTGPLKVITERAMSISRGIFNRPLPLSMIRKQDEIGLLANAFVSMSQLIEGVIGEIEQIAEAIGTGRLDHRTKFTTMEGDFYKIIHGVNNALDVICSHLDAIPVALALYNEEMDMLYRNQAMNDFLAMHDIADRDAGFLTHIAGSGKLSPGQTLDPKVQAIFNPNNENPAPFEADIAMLGCEGGSNYSLTIQRTAMNKSAAKGTEKDTICAIVLLTDVTMLTRAKIDAEAASRAKSDFLSRMSHEIRTPMNAVIGMTQIAMNSSDIKKIHSCLEQVQNSSDHLLGVINDILDFSKIESGKLALDITEFSLSDDLDFVISMMLSKAKEQNITLRLSIENIQNDGVSGDSLRLNQILINLISNAIKFSPKGSEVAVNVRELGSENGFSTYKFEVIDHGIGISEYQASKLFKPFEQADGSITRNYGGTGLGLAISKNLVEMMGGKITLDSKEGEGSTFTFTIICASERSAHEMAKDEGVSIVNHYDFAGKRCLVVDDIEINREIVLELLAGTNLVLETAVNGKDAVDKFRSSGEGYFDIILMDMQMPFMDGCTATREIRQIEKDRAAAEQNAGRVPIVAMTANVLQEDVKKAMDSGMNAHLGKPIELEITLKTIKELLS